VFKNYIFLCVKVDFLNLELKFYDSFITQLLKLTLVAYNSRTFSVSITSLH